MDLDKIIDSRLAAVCHRDKAREHQILSTTTGMDRVWAILAYASERDMLEMQIEEECWREKILKNYAYDPFDKSSMGDDFPTESLPIDNGPIKV